jgi:hypothetical protein
MLRQDDPQASVAEGKLTEIEARPLLALALQRERKRITMLGYKGQLRLMRLDTKWLRPLPLILFIPTGLASRLPAVFA